MAAALALAVGVAAVVATGRPPRAAAPAPVAAVAPLDLPAGPTPCVQSAAPFEFLRATRTALDATRARAVDAPGPALLAQLALLRAAGAYPGCDVTLLNVRIASTLVADVATAVRMTAATSGLSARDRAAAGAALAEVHLSEVAAADLADGEASFVRGYAALHRERGITRLVMQAGAHCALATSARVRDLCPDGTALAACTTALERDGDPALVPYARVARGHHAAQAQVQALRATLAGS